MAVKKKTPNRKSVRRKPGKKKTAKKKHKKSPSRSTIPKRAGKDYRKLKKSGGDHSEIPEPRVGRRTTLTPEVQSDLVKIIQIGNYYATACRYVGVPESTFYRWLERGEKEITRIVELEEKENREIKPDKYEVIYVEFWEAIKRADAAGEVSAVIKVKSAFGDSWQAAMTFLERRHPEGWRRKDRTEITDAEGNPVQVMVYLPDNKRD